MMNFVCKHKNICRDCDACYDEARADSELHEFGVFVPKGVKCVRHPSIMLTENHDCILCCYGPEDRTNGKS